MREHLRAVIWPRQTDEHPTEAKDKDGKPVYRYAIVGMLVTDQPLNLGPSASRGTALCSECCEGLVFNEGASGIGKALHKRFECPNGCRTSAASQKAAAEASKLGPTEYIVDGSAGGLGYTLEVLPKFRPKYPLGEAGDVLVSLDQIVGAARDAVK
jgi:hypothetical protein